jgi:hypothetical protein
MCNHVFGICEDESCLQKQYQYLFDQICAVNNIPLWLDQITNISILMLHMDKLNK